RRHTGFSRDWSSDVCSSDLDLAPLALAQQRLLMRLVAQRRALAARPLPDADGAFAQIDDDAAPVLGHAAHDGVEAAVRTEHVGEIGRASCRERGWGGGSSST